MTYMLALGDKVVLVDEQDLRAAGIAHGFSRNNQMLMDFIGYAIADGSWSPVWRNEPGFPLERA